MNNENINLETDIINSLNRNILQDWCYDEDDDSPKKSDVIAFMNFVIKSCIDNLEEENNRYKQALEEIEEYFSHTDDLYMLEVEYETTAPTILNIINKAKEVQGE